ncbi:MAG: SDR family NAD(P)-dependent oxidoreductase [Balneolaceae bacterium]|nr:SDR family NAD(P)-dependent oxidoreductase [Balneolaceae bacterium]
MGQCPGGVQNEGYKAHGFIFDVTKERQGREHIDKIENEIGPIDILVNNAGIIKRQPLKDMDVEDYRRVIDVDFGRSLYYGAKGGQVYD